MSNSKAIITIAIGDDYLRLWNDKCQKGWQEYANKYGYDVICIDSPLDDSARARQRSASWQKCLILSQKFVEKYERVVWVDADIVINSDKAPCITETIPIEKIGAIDACAMPTPGLARVALDRLYDYWGEACTVHDRTAQEYYASYGIVADFTEVVQAGVLVLSPHYHRQLLEKVYFDYEETGVGHFEMRPLSYELLKADCIHWLDHRFNLVWLYYKALYYPFSLAEPDDENRVLMKVKQKLCSTFQVMSRPEVDKLCVAAAFENSFFLHFAGSQRDIGLMTDS